MQDAVNSINISEIASVYIETIGKMRRAGIAISDRRAVKLQRPIAASALICGRSIADVTDLWIYRQAALLYRARLSSHRKAAEMHCLAGDFDLALAIYHEMALYL